MSTGVTAPQVDPGDGPRFNPLRRLHVLLIVKYLLRYKTFCSAAKYWNTN
jgi:hypothetical protein